jgi:Ca2+-binding RTX toxin-like protein
VVTGGHIIVSGTPDNDVFVDLTGVGHVIFTFAGNDTVCAGDGHDIVFGGAGNDRLFGEGGRDMLFGGGDNDHLDGGPDHDLCHGGHGSDTAALTCEHPVLIP